jgi:hypothetical protein
MNERTSLDVAEDLLQLIEIVDALCDALRREPGITIPNRQLIESIADRARRLYRKQGG